MQWSGMKGCQSGSAVDSTEVLPLLTGAARVRGRPWRRGPCTETGGTMSDGSNGRPASACGAEAVLQ